MIKSVIKSFLYLLFFFVLTVSGVNGQTSLNYKLEEYVFNNGGDPQNGFVLQSPNYSISLDAVGDSIAGQGLTGTSFTAEAGFVSWYPPPGEVFNLHFTDKTTISWDSEPSIGSYNLYSGDVTNLAVDYGICKEAGIALETAVVVETPASGICYFFLVTANNRLDEEGSMGIDSDGSKRSNTNPCL